MPDSLLVPADTTVEAARVQFDVLRKMSAAERLHMGIQLSNNVRSRLEAGVRERHPEYEENQVRLAVLRLLVGEALFKECCPGCTLNP